MTGERSHLLRIGLLLLLVPAMLTLYVLEPNQYTLVAVHATAVPANLYPLVYRTVPWSKGSTGKALMNMALSVALLYDIALLGHWVTLPGFDHLYAAAVTYLGVAITYQLCIMLRLKKSGQVTQEGQKT